MSMQGDTGGAAPPQANVTPTQQAPTNTTAQGDGAAAQQPATTAPVSPPVLAPVPQPAGRIPTRKLLGENDDIPNDAELIELSPHALKSRLDRFTKKQLRDSFGTDDVNSIRSKLQQHQLWEKEREEKRIAELTESQRLQEQLQAANRERDEAIARAEQIQTEQIVSEQDHHVTGIVGKHINPRYLKHELKNLAEYISGLSDAELADPDSVVEAWCATAIKEDPAIAIQTNGASLVANGASQGPPLSPQGQPFTNGANTQRPQHVNPQGIVAPKTFAPNQPGSMSDAEWRAYKRANSWNF